MFQVMSDYNETQMSLQSGNGCGCAGCSGENAVAKFWSTANESNLEYSDEVSSSKPTANNGEFADYLTNGFWQDFYGSNYTFSGHSKENLTFSISNSYNATQATGIRAAFQMWEDIADITFTEVASGADIDVITNNDERAFAANSWSYSNSEGVYEITSTHISIDDSLSFWTNFNTMGNYAQTTILHEIGHTLGLGHSGNYNAGAQNPTYANDAIWSNDTREYTLMSYFSASNSGANHGSSYSATPMLIDIIAIQNLYGANTSTRSGNTTYGFNDTTGRDAYDFTINTAPVVAIWDGGGIDTLDLSGFSNTQTIRMGAGEYSDIGGLTQNLVIALGVDLENVTGGSGQDTIYTNALNNIILGNNGNDYVFASAGTDTINGGEGADTVNYSWAIENFVVSIFDSVTLTVENIAQGFTDTLSNIETFIFNSISYTFAQLEAFTTITGTNGDDSLNGNSGNNTINGGDGNDTIVSGNGDDTLIGGAGKDILYGGGGTDTIDYSANTKGIVAHLGINMVDEDTDIAGIDDTLNSIENVIGTNYNDIIYGNATGNALSAADGEDNIRGYGGNDVIDAGAGNDTVDGGDDNDTISGGAGDDYINAGSGHDTVDGGDDNDSIYGYAGNDDIQGGNGNDNLYGLDDNDTLDGGAGTDLLVGGAGNDTYVFSTGYGNDTINEGLSLGTDTLRITGAIDASTVRTWIDSDRQLTIQLSDGSTVNVLSYTGSKGTSNINNVLETIEFDDGTIWNFAAGATLNSLDSSETLYGTDLNDNVSANGGDDVIIVAEGNDTVDGGTGEDTIYGGDGNDILSGGNDDDTLDGGIGNDILNGGENDDYLNGRDGDDVLNGDNGNDHILAGSGDDILNGGDGEDILRGDLGDDTLRGNDGNDTLYGYQDNDTLDGGAGDDFLSGSVGDDTYLFDTGYGNDRLIEGFDEGTDTLRFNNLLASQVYSNVGVDRVLRFTLDDGSTLQVESYSTSNGGTNAVSRLETIIFSDDTTYDFGNGLILNGLESAQTTYGSDLGDTINANGGNDTVYSGNGNDTINGGSGSDLLDGGNGNDTIYGGTEADTIYGRAGDDILYGDDGADFLFGGDDNDTLYGGDGNDSLFADEGNDTVYGGNGDDKLYGFGGNDTLYGGDGEDLLYGHGGSDTFVFEADSALNNTDHILDFSKADGDRIDLSDVLSNYDSQAHTITDFLQVTEISGHSYISVDTDGGGDSFTQIARITFTTGLTDEAAQLADGTFIV